jgi:hypothetical protein
MGHLFSLLLALLLTSASATVHATASFAEVSANNQAVQASQCSAICLREFLDFELDRSIFLQEQSIDGIRGAIGSRPPSCEGMCRSCGHCEAVQVPISPQELQKKKQQQLGHGSRAAAAAFRAAAAAGGSRAMPDSYYDHSNYKPLSWRCKCGRHILEP